MPAIALSVRDETEYAYSVARVRVLETRLLDRAVLERMVEAGSAEECLRILGETEYSWGLSPGSDPAEFESVLAAELKRVYDYVRGFSPDPALLDVLSLKFDLHNVKVLLKEKRLDGARVERAIAAGGNMDVDEARVAIAMGDYRALPEDYVTVVEKAEKALEETGDPQVIDIVVDREMFRLGLEIARRSRFELLEQIWTTMIDVTNLKSLVRVNRMRRSRDFLQQCLIDGGLIPAATLLGWHGETSTAIADALRYTPYARLAEEGLRHGSRFELLGDDFITGFLRSAKHKAFGPEPVIAYVLAKETEIRNLRVILTGKINGLPPAAIRERLRDTYV